MMDEWRIGDTKEAGKFRDKTVATKKDTQGRNQKCIHQKPGMVLHACNPSIQEAEAGRSEV